MVKIISDHLNRVIEYESRLGALRVDGDNLIQYFQDNPHAKEARRKMLLGLKDEVSTAPIRPFYRESILGEINRYLDTLDGKSDSSSDPSYDFLNDILLPLLGGLGLGYSLKVEAERFVDSSARKLADSIIEEMMKQQ